MNIQHFFFILCAFLFISACSSKPKTAETQSSETSKTTVFFSNDWKYKWQKSLQKKYPGYQTYNYFPFLTEDSTAFLVFEMSTHEGRYKTLMAADGTEVIPLDPLVSYREITPISKSTAIACVGHNCEEWDLIKKQMVRQLPYQVIRTVTFPDYLNEQDKKFGINSVSKIQHVIGLMAEKPFFTKPKTLHLLNSKLEPMREVLNVHNIERNGTELLFKITFFGSTEKRMYNLDLIAKGSEYEKSMEQTYKDQIAYNTAKEAELDQHREKLKAKLDAEEKVNRSCFESALLQKNLETAFNCGLGLTDQKFFDWLTNEPKITTNQMYRALEAHRVQLNNPANISALKSKYEKLKLLGFESSAAQAVAEADAERNRRIQIQPATATNSPNTPIDLTPSMKAIEREQGRKKGLTYEGK